MEQKSPSSRKYEIPDICFFVTAALLLLYLSIIRMHIPPFENESLFAQEFRTGPDVRISGEVVQDKDSFGHRKYSGMVENTLTWRVDFVRVEFKLFNKGGKLLLRKDVFVDGNEYPFQDGTISRSSLDPEQKAAFVCLTPIHADSIAKFEHTVFWMEYDSLPSQAF